MTNRSTAVASACTIDAKLDTKSDKLKNYDDIFEQHNGYREEADGAETGYIIIGRDGAAVIETALLHANVATGVDRTARALRLAPNAAAVGLPRRLVGHIFVPDAA